MDDLRGFVMSPLGAEDPLVAGLPGEMALARSARDRGVDRAMLDVASRPRNARLDAVSCPRGRRRLWRRLASILGYSSSRPGRMAPAG